MCVSVCLHIIVLITYYYIYMCLSRLLKNPYSTISRYKEYNLFCMFICVWPVLSKAPIEIYLRI